MYVIHMISVFILDTFGAIVNNINLSTRIEYEKRQIAGNRCRFMLILMSFRALSCFQSRVLCAVILSESG